MTSAEVHVAALAYFDRLRGLAEEQRRRIFEQEQTPQEVRRAAQRLFDHDTPTDEFLGSPVSRVTASLARALQEGAMPDAIGPFRVLKCIGRGGFGSVYLAQQSNPTRLVAVKALHPGASSEAVQRFTFEAEALARLNHPNIAAIFEVRHDPGTGQSCLVMEYVDGQPLDRYLETASPRLPDRLRLLATICDALHHAHQRGVLHRDLAPKNILVTSLGVPKVIDFGLASEALRRDQPAKRITIPGSVMGTLLYASPEQLDGHNACREASSDVHSLGVIAFEALTGKHPHSGDAANLAEEIKQLRTAEPPRPSSLVSVRSPKEFDAVLFKAVERDASRRYASAAELAADLRSLAADLPVLARAPSVGLVVRRFIRRHRAASVALALALALGVFAAANAMIMLKSEAETRTSAVNALDLVMKRLVSPLEPRVGALGEREKLLAEIEPDVRAMLHRSPHDARIRVIYARFCTAKADVLRQQGRADEALAMYEESVRAYAALAAAEQSDPDTAHSRSMALVKLGDACAAAGRSFESRTHYVQALKMDEQLASARPDYLPARSNLFWSYVRMSELPGEVAEDRAEWIARMHSTARSMIQAAPDDPLSLEAASNAHLRAAGSHIRAAAWVEARNELELAEKYAEREVLAEPNSVVHNATLLLTLARFALIPSDVVDAHETARREARAEETAAVLSRNTGLVRFEAETLANYYTQSVDQLVARGDYETAVRRSTQGLEAVLRILDSPGALPRDFENAAKLHGGLARALVSLGRPAEAQPHRAEMCDLARRVEERFADLSDGPETAIAIRRLHENVPSDLAGGAR